MDLRPISITTYKHFMKKYKIKTYDWKVVKIKKSIPEIQRDIYVYELNNKDNIIDGLYINNPNE